MAGRLFFVLLIAVALSDKPICPQVKCEDMNKGTCARYISELVEINEDGCQKGSHCWATDITSWYDGNISEGDTLSCTADDDLFELEKDAYKDTLSDYSDVECGKRDKEQDPKEGDNPKLCSDSSDCELENGSFADCSCGFDGNKWCRAEWGSDYFDDYWDRCDDEDDKLDYDEWLLWDQQRALYSQLMSLPECGKHIEEFDRLYDLDDRVNVATAISFLAIIFFY